MSPENTPTHKLVRSIGILSAVMVIYAGGYWLLAHSQSCQWIRCRFHPGRSPTVASRAFQALLEPGRALEREAGAYKLRSRLTGIWASDTIRITVTPDLVARVSGVTVEGLPDGATFRLARPDYNIFESETAAGTVYLRLATSADLVPGQFNASFSGAARGFHRKLVRTGG